MTETVLTEPAWDDEAIDHRLGGPEALLTPVRSLRDALRRFGPLARPDRMTMAAAAVVLIVSVAADTAAVFMFMTIIDRVVASDRASAFWGPASVWVGMSLISALATGLGTYLSARAAEHFLLRLRDTVFDHLQTLAPDFFEHHPTGDLVARLSGDVETIESLVSSGVVDATVAVATVAFFAGAAFWLRWDLALVVTALVPLLALVTRWFASRIRGTSRAERLSNGAISNAVEQAVAHVSLTQAYGTEAVERRRVHAEGRAWLRARLAQMRLTSVYSPLTSLFDALGIIAVVGVGAWEIAQGRLTLGGLVAFATFLGFLSTPIRNLSDLMMTVTAARASSDRITEVLETPAAIADPPGAHSSPAREGRVTFSGVGFCYPGSAVPAVSDLTFEVAPGELLLVTGPSGAGKSTLTRLLLRFYDPTCGRIGIDGVDLRDYRLAALRRSVTLLAQDAVIVSGTVTDNIAYGSPGASEDAITAAARAAAADEFIRRLPDGYRTLLGPSGPQLSGGQRQRIAIARALLRDTPVLVLDEPTTGLDAAATAAVLPALRTLIRNRATIVVSHDLGLAPLADRVLVLDGGHLVEQGDHHELLELGGLYRRLHDRQRHPLGRAVALTAGGGTLGSAQPNCLT